MPDETPERIQVRVELLEAMDALHQARVALAGDKGDIARTQLDKATVIIAEVRKKISPSKNT
jgi:hypothetical protein